MGPPPALPEVPPDDPELVDELPEVLPDEAPELPPDEAPPDEPPELAPDELADPASEEEPDDSEQPGARVARANPARVATATERVVAFMGTSIQLAGVTARRVRVTWNRFAGEKAASGYLTEGCHGRRVPFSRLRARRSRARQRGRPWVRFEFASRVGSR
jgi:hypothetical protein